MSKNKHNPKLLAEDIYKYVSQQSSLTQKQVQECFEIYAQLIMYFATVEDKPQDLIITLPKLGNFKFVKTKGRKCGQKYIVPRFENGEMTLQEYTVQADEPDYEKIKFSLYERFQKSLKDTITMKKLKELSLNFFDI